MKKEKFIIFNDIHIKNGNEDSVYEAIEYLVEYSNKKNINEVVLNGDVFDSRSFQRLSHLKCFEKILDLFKVNGIICHTVVGNHDKTKYDSIDNFIEPFKHHPSIKLYSNILDTQIAGINVTISPFFTDKILYEQLSNHNGGNLLIGHWSCEGSSHLGHVAESQINKKLLSKWNKIYLGHYHNHQNVNEIVTHLPSLIQNDFGEDNVKGFTVIYDDLSYELIKGKFKEFKKVLIDLNETSIQSVKELIKAEQNSLKVVRFEFIGDESKLKTLDKSLFNGTGIDVKLKFDKKYDFNEDHIMPTVIERYGQDDIETEFKNFCNNKGYDYEFGKTLLDKFFKNK